MGGNQSQRIVEIRETRRKMENRGEADVFDWLKAFFFFLVRRQFFWMRREVGMNAAGRIGSTRTSFREEIT